MSLSKIDTSKYVKKHQLANYSSRSANSWFKDETMTLTISDSIGAPTVGFHSSDLMYFFANGWRVKSVQNAKDEKAWESKSTSTATQEGTSSAESESENNITSSSEFTSSSYGSSTGSTLGSTSGGSSSGESNGKSNGNSNSKGKSESEANSTNTVTKDGGAYWIKQSTVTLTRRRMVCDKVLTDMIADFTKAYNEGRRVNNDRYEELVSLYTVMLGNTEDEINGGMTLSVDDFKPLAKAVTDSVKDALEKYSDVASDIPEDWLKSRENDINLKFDNLVAEARAKMVTNGTYNSVVWTSTLAGIEKNRAYALTDLKDEMVTLKVDTYGKIASMTADVGQKLLDCEIRIIEAQNNLVLKPSEMRNTVFKWMLDFMERREDEYPGLDKVSEIVASMGFADGAM